MVEDRNIQRRKSYLMFRDFYEDLDKEKLSQRTIVKVMVRIYNRLEGIGQINGDKDAMCSWQSLMKVCEDKGIDDITFNEGFEEVIGEEHG